MKNFVFTKALGGSIKLFACDGSGEVIATFSSDEKGQTAFALFKSGLALQQGATLIDSESGQLVIGDVASATAAALA